MCHAPEEGRAGRKDLPLSQLVTIGRRKNTTGLCRLMRTSPACAGHALFSATISGEGMARGLSSSQCMICPSSPASPGSATEAK